MNRGFYIIMTLCLDPYNSGREKSQEGDSYINSACLQGGFYQSG